MTTTIQLHLRKFALGLLVLSSLPGCNLWKNSHQNQVYYNEQLAVVLETAWIQEGLHPETFQDASLDQLTETLEKITELRSIIEDAQLDELDPNLLCFFDSYNNHYELIPEIAFRGLVPIIPEDEPASTKMLLKAIKDELELLFISAFNTCKEAYLRAQAKNGSTS